MAGKRTRAVCDLGSNSGRVVVARLDARGALEIVADGRAPLRLAKEFDRAGNLSAEAVARTITALRDFQRLARGAGVERPRVVATSAIREAKNREEILSAIRRATGLKVEVLSGDAEARFAFRGAIEKLPVESGLMFDLGGGSLEVTRFARRRLLASWTLPLGALRLSDRFLKGDPPTARQIARLRAHLGRVLGGAELPALESDEQLIATGGTVRNLAKLDRRSRSYPLERLHGYALPLTRLRAIVARLRTRGLTARAKLPGMNSDRADSILGGALCLEGAMEWVGARGLLVSGQGTREGLLYASLRAEASPVVAARDAMLEAVLARFAPWNREGADRRAALARSLFRRFAPEEGDEIAEALRVAALSLDAGRSVDYYNRHRHAAAILRASDLGGMSPREVAFAAFVLERADDEACSIAAQRPLLGRADERSAERAAVVLELAEALLERTAPGEQPRWRLEFSRREARLRAAGLSAWRPRAFASRFEKAFGRRIKILVSPRGEG
ncbi:MAG: Ppx/GppA phosphatase family protein [Candidatus Eisenbacteria bacterium]